MWQLNARNGCELDYFTMKDILGAICETWMGSKVSMVVRYQY